MLQRKSILAAALPAVLLAACGSPQAAAPENGSAEAEAVPANDSNVSVADPTNASDFPPPDAVSHPDGYLPNAVDAPAPDNGVEPKDPPPATEDQYMRNGQGR